MGIDIAFWVLAVLALAGALMSIAGLFITLSADFLGIVQILIYVGAIAVLIIMAIMLTRDVECSNMPTRFKLPAIFSGMVFLGIAIWVMLNTSWPLSTAAPTAPTTATLGNLLFDEGGLVLAVEIAAMLIAASIIGAISVAREK